MSIYSVLNIARTSLAAVQTCLQTASNNIANVNTEGYAREKVILEEATPIPTDLGCLGDGVRVKAVSRCYDNFVEAAILKKNTTLNEQQIHSKYLQRMEGLLDDNNSMLTSHITDFFKSWQDLSTDPGNEGMKETIVAKGQALAQSLKTMYGDLRSIQAQADNELNSEVDDVNKIVDSLAALNKLAFESSGNQTAANDFQDKKTALLKELSGKLDITTFDDEFGRTTVLTSKGKPLVDGGNSWHLKTTPDETTGYSRVAWEDSSGNLSDITDDLQGGTLNALITVRNTTIEGFIDNLDELSQGLIDNVKWRVTGDTSDTSFFSGTSVSDIEVATAFVDDPSTITASSDPVGNPTDNDIALAMASLMDQKVVNDGNSTFTDYVSSMNSHVGELTKTADDAVSYNEDTMKTLTAQRENVSGVSLDEEMANLIKYQYAFQASSRLLSVADQLLQDLMAVGR